MKVNLLNKQAYSLIVAVLLVFFAGNASAQVVDRVVAVVNGELITLFDLNEKLKPFLERFQGRQIKNEDKKDILKLKKDVLDKMIEDILLRQQADEYGIEVSDMEVDNRIRQVKAQNGIDEQELKKKLKLEGLTREQYAHRIKQDILRHRLIGAMVKRKVVVTDEEIKEYYQEHKTDNVREKKLDLNLILVADLDKAKEVLDLIKEDKISFRQAAAEYSIGPQADEGGTLGYMSWNSMHADFKEALQGVQAGEITKPFTFRGNGALLKVVDLEEGEAKPLSEVREEIRDKIYKQKFNEQYEEYLSELKDDAVIDIRL